MAVVLKPLAPEEAIAAYGRRGQNLVPTFNWQDLFEKEHATAFTVAKSAGFDILTDIDKAMTAALMEGTTLEQFARTLKPVLTDKGWWGRKLAVDPLTGEERVVQLGSLKRLRTIFETNMRVSYAAGHWSAFERNKTSRPFLRYVAILDDRTRPAHRARHNLVLPVDHPYWDTWAPPCGWGCRCTLQSLSQRDVERLKRQGENLKFEPPQDTFRDFVNTRTGEVTHVPDGIDPGWGYNPGKAAIEAMLRRAEKLIDAPPRLAATYDELPDWLQKPTAEVFPQWFDEASSPSSTSPAIVVAGALSNSVLDGLNRRGHMPASAAITISQQVVRHMTRDIKSSRGQGVPVDLLRQLPSLLAKPAAVLVDRRDGALVYVFDVPGVARIGKLILRLDYAQKARPPGGKAETVRANAVRTAGLVPRQALADPAIYDLIDGELK